MGSEVIQFLPVLASLFGSKTFKAALPFIVIGVGCAALFFAGWFARGESVRASYAKQLEKQFDDVVDEVKAATKASQQGAAIRNEIRDVPNPLTAVPGRCPVDEPTRVQLNARIEARNELSGGSIGVPGAVPAAAPDAP